MGERRTGHEPAATRADGSAGVINNTVYKHLGERWYLADDDPIALLRAESLALLPWILKIISEKLRDPERKVPKRILDVGCGGGFLSNQLASAGHNVTGVDMSEECLTVAREHSRVPGTVFLSARAEALPFPNQAFDAVCVIDLLEHVEDYRAVVREAARVLRPGGLFFYHTFDRNPLAWLVIIKFVEWFVRNVPTNLHLYSFFIKPQELNACMSSCGLTVSETRGLDPKILSLAALKIPFTGRISPDFRFQITRSSRISYVGVAVKKPISN